MGEVVCYARTSTADQQAGLDDQLDELRARGGTKFFHEQVSGVDASRPQLKAALAYLREGDVFMVTKPCRLARSTADLLAIVAGLKTRGITVKVLSMDIDTATATGELILTVLAGVATFERLLMLERQRAGIKAAKAAGKYKGRAPTARRKAEDIRRLKSEGVSPVSIARTVGVSRASVYRVLAAAAPA